MKAITFTVELLEPMLCVGLEGDPNAGVSLKYIPGSVLRGAIIGKYGKIRDASAKPENELFFNGAIRYLNAYALIDGKRSLPVPLSWHKEKDAEEKKGSEFYDLIQSDSGNLENPKTLNATFFSFKNTSNVYKAEIKTRLAVHTQRDAKKGRATSESGAVFRYESIVKGTKFGGAIIGETDELFDKILKLVSDDTELFVGGSRTGGYGKAKITGAKIEEWREPQTKPAEDLKENDVFTITLLSDAHVRNENGQFVTDVSAALNNFGVLDKDKTYKKAEIVGGFNRKWGLPLPQITAVKAGSVFTFKAARNVSASEMQILIDSGIGDKRLDGFGRIAVNLSENEEFGYAEVEKQPNEAPFKSIDLGGKILKQIVRQRMEKRLLDTLANHRVTSVKIKEKISNSQISRLRLLLRRVLRKEKGVEAIGEFFNDLKKTARDQFQSVKVSSGKNQGNLQHWIVESLGSLELFGKDIRIGLGGNSGAVEADNRDEELQLEFHLHLIDGILARAAKENKQ